jgi:hypothetical protein
MKVWGRTTVSEFLQDFVVYRNLVPADPRLRGLAAIRKEISLAPDYVPRKSEPDYARVIVHLLRQARALEYPRRTIRRLLYVGDTRLNDGTAFANVCAAGQWPGLAFIAAETQTPLEVKTAPAGEQAGERGTLYLTNRWSALYDFAGFCEAQGFVVDEQTAVIVDLDKTALGARGRNAHVIDQARVTAVRHTVAELLGDAFNEQTFRVAYDQLNEQAFHHFTADNQDYLAYICLILGSGLYEREQVVADVQAGRLTGFRQFIAQVDQRTDEMPPALVEVHSAIYANVQAGDPTPFKSFRYNEYRTTVARMGQMPDDAPAETLLAEEIVITEEVRRQALQWQAAGALLFGLSDKPDEASIPGEALAARGYRSIHQTATHAVGV